MKKISMVTILAAAVCFAVTNPALAEQDRQFETSSYLSDQTPIRVTVVASSSEEGRAQAAISQAISRAAALDGQLFGAGGIEAAANGLSKGQSIKLSPDATAMMKKAVDLSAQTKGFFDIAAPSPKNWFQSRDWHSIAVNTSDDTLSFRATEIKLDLRRIAKGYIADMVIDELKKSGFANAMVEVGPIHRNIGRNIFTPWNIAIGFGKDDGSQYARQVRNFNFTNVAAATVTPEGLGQGAIDGLTKKPADDRTIKSITIFANDASTATAFAMASYVQGSGRAMKYIERHPEIRGIIVDANGSIAASPNMHITNFNEQSIVQQTGDGGSNDLKQKEREESSDR